MENMRASPLEYVSMGTPVERGTHHIYTPCSSPPLPPRSLLFVPPSSDSYTSLDFLPCIVVHATQPYITRPSLPPPHSSLSLCLCLADSWSLWCTNVSSCVCVDTNEGGRGEKGEREFIESAYVCLPPGIQLERAIGPNGMKFLCGQTQERSRASFYLFFFFFFSRPTPNHSPPPSPPSIYTIFVQPELRVIEMAVAVALLPKETGRSHRENVPSVLPSIHERIDGISFF